MTQSIVTEIDGYEVELVAREVDCTTSVNCYITKRTANRSYTASLSCLQDTGELDWNGYCHPVHPQTINEIERWALANGY